MESYITGNTIRTLREGRGMTQKQLAGILSVSDKAVSKWETGRGLPDITLIEPIAAALGVSVAELLAGEQIVNRNRAGNLLRGAFYVCPICGNVVFSVGRGAFSCCGVSLPPLEAEAEEAEHPFGVEIIDGQRYVSLEHPMERDHYITFMAYVTTDKVHISKLYPEQNAEARFPIEGHGMLYICCNRHGLFSKRV